MQPFPPSMQNLTRPAIARLSDSSVLNIVQHCLDTPAIIPPQPGDERATLMSICRQWRTLISLSPHFWNNVIFLPVANGPLAQLAGAWLQRTAGVPVSIAFNGDFSKFNGGTSATHVQQLIYGAGALCVIQSIILPCIDRITSLTCTLATDHTMRTFFTIPAGRFLSLSRLEILLVNQLDNHRSSFYPWEFPNFTVFRGLPALRKVTVRLLNGMNPRDLGLPWDQLTNLDFSSTPMPPDIFLNIMQTTRNSLITGSFQIKATGQTTSRKRPLAIHFQESHSFEAVTAHALKDLHLIVAEPSQDRKMFKAMRLPALTLLSIEAEDTEEGRNLDLYLPLLKKTPSLKYFSIDCGRSRPMGPNTAFLRRKIAANRKMENFFSAVPTIQDLHLGLGFDMGSLTLRKLARGDLLPELEVLECSSVGGLDVLSMVRQRNDAAKRISLHLSGAGFSGRRNQPTTSHKSISLLQLFVPAGDLDEVEAEAETFLQHQSAVDTEIFIEGKDRRLFY